MAMDFLSYTLLTDGPSDRRLMPLINWALRTVSNRALIHTWADLSVVKPKPYGLRERLAACASFYESQLLFVHRDAEGASLNERLREITEAREGLDLPPLVAIVTVRMQEAWFLFDERAIRMAAGNRHSDEPLLIPPLREHDTITNPKALLFQALQTASGLDGRHLRRFDAKRAAYRVAELIQDFSPLRGLQAFERFEGELTTTIQTAALR